MTRYSIPALAMSIALCLVVSQTKAQVFVNWTTDATGNWTDGNNWFNEGTSSTGAIPSVDYEEVARIDGGNVTINTPLADGIVNGSSSNPGSLLLGNQGGTSVLTIESGGSLHVQAGVSTNGFLDIGFGPGVGTVAVLPGGSLAVDGFFSTAFNPLNTMQFGAASGAGTATVTAGMSLMAGTTIIHPNASVSITNQLETAATTVYRPVYSGGNLATMNVGGPLRLLGGTLRPDSGGATLPVNTPKTLIEADSIVGAFDGLDTSLLGPAGAGQAYVTNIVEASGDREALQFSLRQMVVLNVDRDTGAVSITNLGTADVTLDGYTIASAAGSLAPGNWASLDDGNSLGGDWQESPTSVNRLSELKEVGIGTVTGGATYPLGNIYDATSGDFGDATEDLTFHYTTSDGDFEGIINYTGLKVNTLLLQVDPITGEARLRNTSDDTVSIDGYTVSSADGLSLDPTNWNSLDAQDAAGGDWSASPGTTGRLSELKESASTTLAPGAMFELGGLFKVAEAKDLSFQFLLAGSDVFDPTEGAVIYEAFAAGVAGDYNNNGIVDAADYTKWRDSLGTSATLPNDTTPGTVTQEDYTVWKTNFGLSAGAGAVAIGTSSVPEPTSLALLAGALAMICIGRRSRCA